MKRTVPALVLVALVLGPALALAGCGSSGPVPDDAVQSYLSDLAEGNYTNACGMLSAGARAALVSANGERHGCPAIYHHCLPSDPQTLKRDQTQLLFDTVQSFVHGSHARVLVQGTSVAREIKRVALVRDRSRWLLVSPGEAVSRCHYGRAKRRRRSSATT